MATLGQNAIQLVFTVVFTRLLGGAGYGSLAALVSAFLVLMVGGQALQVAVARETALGGLGQGPALAATLGAWTRRIALGTVAAAAVGWLAREPLAHLVGVPDHPVAAAAILPTGALWLLLSVQRGALQGIHAFAPVGASLVLEALGRLACGLALVGAGADVTGAYLATPLSLALTAVALAVVLQHRLGHRTGAAASTLGALLRGAGVPIAALGLLALLLRRRRR